MALITSDRARFPNDPWQLVETVHLPGNAGTLETLFSLGNGHLGIRGAHWAAADAELPGSFINGFHETWDIKHAENAYGFARTGQRILYIPDANNFTVIIDGETPEPGRIHRAGLPAERRLRHRSLRMPDHLAVPLRRHRDHHRTPRRRLRVPRRARHLAGSCRGPGHLR